MPSPISSLKKFRLKPGDYLVVSVPRDTNTADINGIFAALSPIPEGAKVVVIGEHLKLEHHDDETLKALGLKRIEA